jgi:hypothetical protein
MGENKAHVVAVPSLGQGHLIPFLELAKLLASQGLAVSYVTTPGNVNRLNPQVECLNLDIRLVSLPLPPIEGVPPGIESTDSVPVNVIHALFASSHKLAGAFEEWLDQQMSSHKEEAQNFSPSTPLPVSCIIGDMCTGWAQRSGAKFGIPTVVFYTTGAFSMSVMHSIFNHVPQKSVEGDDDFFEVPKLSFPFKLRKSEMSVAWRDPDSHPLWGFFREELNQSMEGRGILINTFYELDYLGIDHIANLTGKPVWSIGPILPLAVFDEKVIDRENISSRGKAADISEDDCLRWLDSRRPQSVVFVCLGSHFFQNDTQIRALAAGLEASGQDFMWVIKCPTADHKPIGTGVGLPEGFGERTRERGLIIWGWAPQLLILSHPSVGAFLSHCGWNSTLESVSAGVPMITWPMMGDQSYNSKLLVERLGMAISICVDVDGVPDAEEVRRAVTMLLAKEEGKAIRKKAQELRKLAKMSVGKEGSSYKNLQGFIDGVQQLHKSRVGLPEFEGY